MTQLFIDDRRVDVWMVHSDQIADTPLLDEYRARLPREEVERADRFVFERSRQEHLVTRMLVRSVLSHYTGHDVSAWQFAGNAYGKPSVAVPPNVSLGFNLSHAEGLIVCAVTAGCEVGVDVEHLGRAADHLTLARRYFAASETAAIEQAAAEKQARLFLRFWTLKEAFIKARGMGLSIPLDNVEFALATDRPPRARFKGKVDESPADWQFAEIVVAGRHQVALAARMPQSGPFSIIVRETVPLRRQSDGRALAANAANRWAI